MKKELKDYLHLYLGANYSIRWIKTKRTSRKQRKGVVSYGSLYNILRALNNPEYYEVKLFLRRLSDITEEEKKGLCVIDGGKILLETDEFFINEGSSMFFKFLLSNYFDLFGLIESGLAIDKTTM